MKSESRVRISVSARNKKTAAAENDRFRPRGNGSLKFDQADELRKLISTRKKVPITIHLELWSHFLRCLECKFGLENWKRTISEWLQCRGEFIQQTWEHSIGISLKNEADLEDLVHSLDWLIDSKPIYYKIAQAGRQIWDLLALVYILSLNRSP